MKQTAEVLAAHVVVGARFTVKLAVLVAVPAPEVKVTVPVVPAPINKVAVVAVVPVIVAAVPPIVAELIPLKFVPVTTSEVP